MAKEETERMVSRRDFLKGTAAATGAVALMGPGVSEAAEKTDPMQKWDMETDVVCVGYGGAGAATAVSAHDAGARVLILEKMPDGGGNTAVSAGGFISPTNAEEAYTYFTNLYKFSFSEMDADVVRVYADESVKNVDWIKSLREGTEVMVYGHAGYPTVPGAKSMNKYGVLGKGRGMSGRSQNLWEVYTYAVETKRKIPVMTNTPAKSLVTNCAGEVFGVIAESKGKEIAIKAKRAVVLTCGGYEFDRSTLQNMVKGFPIYGLGNPGNTGDGIRMAQKVGAGIWHMNGASCPFGIKVPEFEAALYIQIGLPGFVYVDKHGKRFVDEKSIETHAGLLAVDYYDAEALEYPRIPFYVIFDETVRAAGPVSISVGRGYAGRRYKWSADNKAEIEKGWIIKGDTFGELASKIKIRPPKVLEQTMAKWNEDVKADRDTLFHRPVQNPHKGDPAYTEQVMAVWSAPIEKPPFYAMELYPCLLNTQGGPRRDSRGQILDAFKKPIPRLYDSGELGSMWGVIYQGAGNNAESMIFGRISGRNAAAEKPWA